MAGVYGRRTGSQLPAAANPSSLATLPSECLTAITDLLSPNHIPLVMRRLSKEWRQRHLQHTRVTVSAKDRYVPAWAVLAALPDIGCRRQKQQLLAAMARSGDLQGMQELAQHPFLSSDTLFISVAVLCAAAGNGHLDVAVPKGASVSFLESQLAKCRVAKRRHERQVQDLHGDEAALQQQLNKQKAMTELAAVDELTADDIAEAVACVKSRKMGQAAGREGTGQHPLNSPVGTQIQQCSHCQCSRRRALACLIADMLISSVPALQQRKADT